jgi:hypothetical protein
MKFTLNQMLRVAYKYRCIIRQLFLDENSLAPVAASFQCAVFGWQRHPLAARFWD